MSTERYRWQPTTLEIAQMAGVAVGDVLRFDHNTSPFPSDWATQVAASEVGSLNEYPAADYRGLREAAAALTGLDPGQIVPGAGVDELILLCGRAFLGPDRRAVQITPTYPLYRIATAQARADLTVVVAPPPSFSFPTEPTVAAARDADLVWLCVPNNPTGTTATHEDVDAVIAACKGVVIIDAAYAEFADLDWVDTVHRSENVIVLRTLSKAFGLAGARVGYAMAHESLIDVLDGMRPPGSISRISAVVAEAALQAPDRMERDVAVIIRNRDDLEKGLTELGWDVLPSHANFLLSAVGPDAADISSSLMDRGLVVRTFPYEPLTEHIRVTVRTPDQHDRLLAEIRRVTT